MSTDMALKETFAERLRAARVASGKTQAEVAAEAGIHQPDLCDLEKGRHAPTLPTIEKLALSLGVEPSYFFLEDSPVSGLTD
jgi:transcriptional regulator with XRE-family HTH domain